MDIITIKKIKKIDSISQNEGESTIKVLCTVSHCEGPKVSSHLIIHAEDI